MLIIGADEAGYGCAAGILSVCAYKAEDIWTISGLNDSKKLSEKQRFELESELIKNNSYYVAKRTSSEIDKYGLGKCLDDAYIEAITNLYSGVEQVIIDGSRKIKELKIPYSTIIKADAKYSQVMAASVLAKCAHDHDIINLHSKYPEYNFLSNKGYLTKDHKDNIKKYGLLEVHRHSYKIK